jgi:hypothetical protein
MASDWEDTSLIAAPFKCTCMREFRQESAYTKHQRSCAKGKKRLFSALSKAKNLLGSVKRPRVDRSHGTQHASTNTVASSVHPSADLINGRLDSSLSGILLNETPHAGSLSQGNVAASASNAGLDSAPIGTDEDQDLPLAQRRSRRVDVPMPLRFRQYEDVLPQPPPSVTPGHTNSAPGFSPPVNSTDASTSTPTSSEVPPFRTTRNVFGLIRQFFSSTPPSHDPEEALTLQDISSVQATTLAEPDTRAEHHDISFHPYPNRSSFELGHWYWHGGVQKSHQSFKELIDIVGHPDFHPDDVRSTPWEGINSRLGASVQDDEGDEWEDEDAGWRKTPVTIEVPFSRTTAQPGARPYVAANLYHRSLTSVIREKLSNAQDDELFHYEPYNLRWSAPHLPHEVNIQGELYTSPAFIDAHRELQESPREAGCDLPRVVVALMFWSDATQLTTFGNAKLWPVYMYFGNESKYRRCKPTCNLSNHVAYFQKV